MGKCRGLRKDLAARPHTSVSVCSSVEMSAFASFSLPDAILPATGMLTGSFDLPLVVASYLIATCAAYVALTVARRIASASNLKPLWLIAGACSMGGGIWSMHFVGMLAFSLPIPLGYDLQLTLLSLVIAVLVSLFALKEVSRSELSAPRLVLGGVLMGSGIAAMHYTGMAAMKMQPGIVYDPLLFAASLFIAIIASIAALWTCFVFSHHQSGNRFLPMIAAALVMGLAIVGMHYTGMLAASFPAGSICGAAGALHGAELGRTASSRSGAAFCWGPPSSSPSSTAGTSPPPTSSTARWNWQTPSWNASP